MVMRSAKVGCDLMLSVDYPGYDFSTSNRHIRHFTVAKAGRRGMVGADAREDQRTKRSAAEKPHYHGHRERLRERFRTAGPDAVSDYELLEMVLFTAQPRGDMKPAAKALLKKFGSFAEVMHAPEAL